MRLRSPAVLAVDLGTGGAKAALVDARARVLASAFIAYPTHYPEPGYHEQDPEDWWGAVVSGAAELLAGAEDIEVAAIALSGQSLAYVPTDAQLKPLLPRVPIWSDARAKPLSEEVFERLAADDWYLRTGNGFPAELYTVFKHLWLQRSRAEALAPMRWLLGSKDWINARLTGVVATDHSYASGLGAYSLEQRDYDDDLLGHFGLDRALLPPIVQSHEVVGGLTAAAASELGLPVGTPVVAGGVDNACMALGAGLDAEGRTYLSLGSSNWLTVASRVPVLDAVHRPFVFAHVLPGLNISALSTFGGGSSLNWLAEVFDIEVAELLADAAGVPTGAHGVVCVPALAGGTVLEGGSEVRGAFVGLELGHGRGDLARAVLEGIALALGRASEELSKHVELPSEILAVGGGARSDTLLQALSDVLDRRITRVANDQQSATLGAAVLGFMGVELWESTEPMHAALERTAEYSPNTANQAVLALAREAFEIASGAARSQAPALAALRTASRSRTEKEQVGTHE